jgi:hypothetical protein
VCAVAALVFFAGGASAGSRSAAESAFREGVRLYEEGRFSEALEQWRAAREEGYASEDLYLNLGNACYRAGEAGWAVYYYEMARRRAPSDPDIAANLAVAQRDALGGEVQSPSAPWLLAFAGQLDRVSLGGAMRFAVVSLWIGAALVIFTWVPRLATLRPPGPIRALGRPRVLRGVALGIVLAAGIVVGLKAAQQSLAPDAIAVSALTAHTEPSEDAAVEFRLPEGSPVGLGRKAPGWREVIVSHSLRGWVPEGAVALL